MTAIDLYEFSNIRPVRMRLPKLARDVAGHRATLGHRLIAGDITLRGQTYHYANSPVLRDRLAQATMVTLNLEGAPLTLAITADVWNLVAPKLTRPTTAQAVALAVEHLLTGDLDGLERAQGVTVEITSVTQETKISTAPAILHMDLTPAGQTAPIEIYAWAEDNTALATRLAKSWPKRAPRDLPQLKFQAAYIGPVALLSHKHVRNLQKGDVVCVAEDWCHISDHISLLIRNEYILPLHAGDSGLVAAGTEQSMQGLRNQFRDGATMPSSKDSSVGSLADPKTLITIELDRAELTLSELQDIQNGDILDFNTASVDTVRVCADGTPIAEGRLVQLDETFGIQVTKLL